MKAGLLVIGLSAVLLGHGAAPANDLQALVASGQLDDLRWPAFQDVQPDVTTFYQGSQYTPAWTRNALATPQAMALIAILNNAAAEGLDPQDYEAGRWQNHLAVVNQDGGTKFDVALSVSVARYVAALRYGRANPNPLHPGLPDVLRELTTTPDVNAVLGRQEPSFPGYRLALQALARYRALAQSPVAQGPKLPATRKPADPGSTYAGTPRLAALLQLTGDLSNDAPFSSDSQDYRGPLVDAVKHFQLLHGLDPDGRIGAKTLEALNTPLSDRVRQLKLTLERWRESPHQFSAPPIIVNIPEFRLRVMDDQFHSVLDMKVVTGKAGRLHTPVFSAAMESVVFRPYWNVPLDIQRRELIPDIEKDPDYLAKNGYEVVTPKEHVITNGTVTPEILAQLRRGTLHIRQVPGPKNALGAVKFLLPNDNDVYLHDTPARQLFERSRRDFSHGCIRLEKAVALAQYVLRDQPEWTLDKMQEAMDGDKPVTVKLTHPIPVLIVYATAVAHADGTVSFLNDIYGMDADLQRQLDAGFPYSGPAATSGAPAPRPRG